MNGEDEKGGEISNYIIDDRQLGSDYEVNAGTPSVAFK